MSPPAQESSDSRLVAVVGPTASGKSSLALALADRFAGEIVNADAFQFYRGMDIGTAKASAAEQSAVPHHCLDFLDIAQPASLADYQSRARSAVQDILRRRRTAIVVGGSALYVTAVCDELDIPPRDPDVRRRLTAQAEEVGGAAMHEMLRIRDPQAAADIDPRNVRRVVRALEVVELTGSFRARMPERRPWRPTIWLMPRRTRQELDSAIELRTAQMWSAGFLAEVADLAELGLADSPTAAKAVGYPQGLAVVAGTLSPGEALADTVAATRKLARRQERTFRSDDRIQLVGDAEEATEALGKHGWVT